MHRPFQVGDPVEVESSAGRWKLYECKTATGAEFLNKRAAPRHGLLVQHKNPLWRDNPDYVRGEE